MEPARFEVRYPRGTLPAFGWRCPRCGKELLAAGVQTAELDERARALGLFGVEHASRRRLQRTGGSITVSLDPELLREVLPGARPGTEVWVGRLGGRIVIEPVHGG